MTHAKYAAIYNRIYRYTWEGKPKNDKQCADGVAQSGAPTNGDYYGF